MLCQAWHFNRGIARSGWCGLDYLGWLYCSIVRQLNVTRSLLIRPGTATGQFQVVAGVVRLISVRQSSSPGYMSVTGMLPAWPVGTVKCRTAGQAPRSLQRGRTRRLAAVCRYTIILATACHCRPAAICHCRRYRLASHHNSGPVLGKHDMHVRRKNVKHEWHKVLWETRRQGEGVELRQTDNKSALPAASVPHTILPHICVGSVSAVVSGIMWTCVVIPHVVAQELAVLSRVLGCLIVELFLSSKLRALDSCNSACFDQRLEACYSVLRWSSDSLPHCARHIVSLLLQVELSREAGPTGTQPFRYPTVTPRGLPPPSAHQLLQTLLFPAVLPFPRHFPHLFRLLEALCDYEDMTEELMAYDDGVIMENEVTYKAQLASKVAECRVKTSARELAVLLPQLSGESLCILLPYVIRLLEDPTTSVLAAWYLFDPVATALGPRQTAEHLLAPVIGLYDCKEEGSMDSCNKHLKLYHHSFLLQLVVRLGLRMFLRNFVAPLVEAVGGYRDLGHTEGTSHHQRASTSHLKYVFYCPVPCVTSLQWVRVSEFETFVILGEACGVCASTCRSYSMILFPCILTSVGNICSRTCDIEENMGEIDTDQVLSPIEEDFSAGSDHRNLHQEESHVKESCEDTQHSSNECKDNEYEVVVTEVEDGKVSPVDEEETELYNIMAQLDLNISQAGSEGEGEGEAEDTAYHNIHEPRPGTVGVQLELSGPGVAELWLMASGSDDRRTVLARPRPKGSLSRMRMMTE
ncbi:hypothetical protein PR048_028306 [Dryococelus australis]|uniref:Uncharacterized protein n=1 Tax=Dryococelus australis TaxID=614101 RepID=A0ABQ9GIY3_9NEOP|nr:hypothetical protein PR048_028306 [Dryococelus australis]